MIDNHLDEDFRCHFCEYKYSRSRMTRDNLKLHFYGYCKDPELTYVINDNKNIDHDIIKKIIKKY